MTSHEQRSPSRASLATALRRGAFKTCPKCGQGQLFAAYLKPVAACSACGEPIGHIRADDGPAWLTMLLTGHIVGPGLVMTQMRGTLTTVQGAWLWMSVAIALVLTLLPITKGVFIALLWQSGAAGGPEDGNSAPPWMR